MVTKLRLASQSPRRRELIKFLGFPFVCKGVDSDETTTAQNPYDAACEISLGKAVASLKDAQPEAGEVIIGADTTVVAEGKTLGKPKDRRDAFYMLSLLSGKTHSVFTGVTLIYMNGGEPVTESFAVETKVTVDNLTDEEINRYLDIGEYTDKAGAYAIQGPFSAHISKIDGDYNNVVGFPVNAIYNAISKL